MSLLQRFYKSQLAGMRRLEQAKKLPQEYIDKEYQLIKQGISKLPSMDRKHIVWIKENAQ